MARLFIVLSLLIIGLLPAHAGDAVPAAIAQPPAGAAPPICPQGTMAASHPAQIALTDCRKGHKGVCGRRAGKIVCCDNTVSPTCTCHSDWSEAL